MDSVCPFHNTPFRRLQSQSSVALKIAAKPPSLACFSSKDTRKSHIWDTDVGQPEFTAPGFLSLTVIDKRDRPPSDLTIPCVKTPERCFFFGDVSSKRDPAAYVKYVFTLYDYYRTKYSMGNERESQIELPLVVNTPGWVKGIGYNILVDILKYIAPSHVVKINISVASKNLPSGAFWLDGDNEDRFNLLEIKSARQDSLNRSILVQKDASLLRDFRLMAYFRQWFHSSTTLLL